MAICFRDLKKSPLKGEVKGKDIRLKKIGETKFISRRSTRTENKDYTIEIQRIGVKDIKIRYE